MDYLNVVDYAIILVYFSVLVGMGCYLQKKASSSIEDYFLGGRSLPWWALGISGMASWLDITGTMLIVSFLYILGPRGLYIELRGGVGLILVVCLLWTGKWHRRSKCITGAEWMTYRFGDGLGGQFARLVSAIAAVIGTVGMLAYMVRGVGLFLSMFFPFTPFQCAVVLVAVATIYTVTSGFYGVVFTDIFQSGVILIAVISVSAIALVKIGKVDDFGSIAASVTGSKEWMSSKLSWITDMPKGYEAFKHLTLFAAFYLLRNVIGGMGAGAEPKYFGAKNDRECGTLSFLWTWLLMFRWPMMISFAVLGIFLVKDVFPDHSVLTQSAEMIKTHAGQIEQSQWPELLSNIVNAPGDYPEIVAGLKTIIGDGWQDKLQVLSYDGTVNPERILPAVIIFDIPMGLRGMILIALIAASMSTFDSTVNATTAYFTRDIYQRLRPKASTKELVSASWIFAIAIVIIGFVLGYKVTTVNAIWGWIVMGLGGGLLVPGFLRLYWWRFNGGGFAVSMVAGMFAAVFNKNIWFGLERVCNYLSNAATGIENEQLRSAIVKSLDWGELNDWKLFILMFTIGLIAAVIGTYMTKPTDSEVLKHFYKTTRPFGIWGKLKGTLRPEICAQMNREHRNDILALPFNIIWHITLLMLPMQLIIGSYKAFGITLIFFIVGLSGMYVFWYRNLPKENFCEELEIKESRQPDSVSM